MAYTLSDWQAGTRPPKGWDVADAIADGWTRSDLDTFMRASVRPWSPPADAKPASEPAEKPAASAGPSPSPSSSKPSAQARTTQQEKPATVTNIATRKTVAADDSWMMGLVCNAEGEAKPGVTKNWFLYLENDREMIGVFAFDAFKRRVMLMRRPPWEDAGGEWEPRVLQDRDYSEAVMWLETRRMTPKASSIVPVIDTLAQRHSFDRLDEYLSGLEWDGTPRVERFLVTHWGAADTAYNRTVAKRWLVSAVARALKPGCKVDTMPVFEGPQGARKSTGIKFLFGEDFFTDGLSDIGSKDAMMEMEGVWCIEVAEMHSLNAHDANAVKKFLSRQVDRYRPPYGRSVIEAPRRCLLGGTMNPEGNPYFKDSTGARRFWPVVVGLIELEKIQADRDQIWAEAVQLYLAGTPWWVQPDEAADVADEQEKRIDVDVWASLIAPMLQVRTSLTQWELLEQCGVLKKDAGPVHAARIGRIMKRLGWVASRDRTDGEDRTIYEPPGLMGGGTGEGEVW